jgi:hypothetical protein
MRVHWAPIAIGRRSFVLLSALCSLASSAAPDARSGGSSCTGYLVRGAGDAAVNGCYKPVGLLCGQGHPGFVLDKTHQLYSWDGQWKLGVCGKVGSVTYAAAHRSTWPPPNAITSCGEFWVAVNSTEPCPSVERSNLGPTPPPPPPPPGPPAAPPPPPMRLVVEEHFDGETLNASLWNVLEQAHRGGLYLKENVNVINGALVLRTIAQNVTQGGVDWFVTSGAVTTANKFAQVGGGGCKGGWLGSKYPMIGAHGDWTSNWAVFQLDWTETWITMSVNGKLYANYDNRAGGGERLPALNDPMFLWLTACVMHRVPPTTANVFPLEYMIDYVKIWEWVK